MKGSAAARDWSSSDHWRTIGMPGASPLFTETPFLKRLFERYLDGVLAMDAHGYRVYSNPSLDAMVGGGGRLPLRTPIPPPYVPSDQHRTYFGLLEAVPRVLANTGSASGELVLTRSGQQRFQVDVTIGALAPPRGSFLAVWLIRNGSRVDRDPVLRSSAESSRPGRPATGDLTGFETLTRREAQVLDLLLDGWRVGSIATGLFVSEHTVRNHLKAVLRKLDAHSQRELIEKVRARRT